MKQSEHIPVSSLTWLKVSIVTAIVYVAAGHLGLLLAVPPSNASPIWPPAGIALAAMLLQGRRAIPGIFLGSYLVHLTAFLDASSAETVRQALLIGLGTSAGSTLQAWVGYRLVRRFVRQPLTLNHEREIFRFVLLGGLAACVVAATIGVLSLLMAGAFPFSAAPLVWGTWWVGDTTGAIIVTPMVLAFFARPAAYWRPRRTALVIPLLVSLALSIAFFVYATRQVHDRVEAEFYREIDSRVQQLQARLDAIEHFLLVSRAFISASEQVTDQEFLRFVRVGSAKLEGLAGLRWLRLGASGQWQTLHLAMPGSGACSAIDPPQADSAPPADFGSRPRLTYRPNSCLDMRLHMSLLSNPTADLDASQDVLVGAIDSSRLFQASLANTLPPGSEISVYLDDSRRDDRRVFHREPERRYAVTTRFRPGYSARLLFGGQTLQVEAISGTTYVAQRYGWDAWSVLSGGLLFSSLLGIGLLILTGRTAHTESMVTARTSELKGEVEERRRTERLLALQNTVLEMVARDETLQTVLNTICTGFEELSRPGTLASVMVVDSDQPLLRLAAGPSLPAAAAEAMSTLPIGENEGSCGTAVYHGEQVACADIATDTEWGKYRDFALAHGLRACWSTPFFDKSGRVLGSFALTQTQPRTPTPRDQQHIRTATFLCSLAVEQANANLHLNRLSLAVEQSPSSVVMTDLDGAIEYVNEQFCNLSGYSRRDSLGKRITGLLHTDLSGQQVAEAWQQLRQGHEWRGTLKHRRPGGGTRWVQTFITPVRDSRNEITHMVAILDDVTELRESTEKITYQATHDLLTGLLNRPEFEARLEALLESARNNDQVHALCFIDLDQFKIVNDTDGHVAGDELLRQLGTLMRQHIRRNDALARIGGDEFAILFEHCGIEKAVENTEKLRELISEHPFTWEKRSYSVGMSAGLVELNRNSPGTTELLREADAACYTAKETGRNRVQVYSPDDETTARRSNDMRWATQLREAIAEDRLVLYQQPIASLRSDTPASTEILVRLVTREGEQIPPGAFLPAAERYDIAPILDAWVIRNTFDFLASQPAFLDRLDYCAINLSGQTLEPAFAQTVLQLLQQHDVPARKICFEITETSAIANLGKAIAFINTLRQRGVRFALDDFGTGLSSFAYLKNLPVDVLKIDGQFVRDILTDPVDLAMVRAIIEIGKVLNKHTVAEFVESDAMLERLRELKVDAAQGYGISKPRPLREPAPGEPVGR